MVGWVQARDPATSSINYRCTTAGMTVIFLVLDDLFHADSCGYSI